MRYVFDVKPIETPSGITSNQMHLEEDQIEEYLSRIPELSPKLLKVYRWIFRPDTRYFIQVDYSPKTNSEDS